MVKHQSLLVGLAAAGALLAAVVLAQQSDTVVNPFANTLNAAADGQRTFQGACQNCHGVGAVGDADRSAPALNTTGLKNGDADGDLFRIIRNGVPGGQMPSFRALSDTEVWQLVSYIRSLQTNAPGANAANAGAGGAAAGRGR